MFLLETIVTTGEATMSSAASTTASAETAAVAAKSIPDIGQMLQRVNWAAPSWDLFIVLFFVVAVFLYGMSLGRDRIIITLVGIYMALAVVQNAPFLKGLQADVAVGDFFAFRVSTFLGVFVVLFFMLSRSALLRTFGNLASGKWWQVLLFSIFHVGLLISTIISYLPGDAINNLAPLTRQVFSGEMARFAWVTAPILAMMLIREERPPGFDR